MAFNDNQPLSRREASAYLKEKYGTPGAIAASTLAKLAVIGGGPEFEKFGSRVAYRISKLDEYALSRCSGSRKSTSSSLESLVGGSDV